jgi:hypothetical protein
MALVRVKAFKNGRCRRGSRHVKGRAGCWGLSKSMMGKKKK